MLKKLFILIILVVLVVAAAIGYILYNANSFIAILQPQAEQMASQMLNTPVKLGTINTKFFPTFHLTVDKFSLGADQDSQGVNFSNLSLDADLRAFLDKRLLITKLTLTKPQIVVVKDAQGIFIEGLPRKKPAKAPVVGQSPPTAKAPISTPITINVEAMDVKDASLIFEDQVNKQRFEVSPVNINLKIGIQGTLATVSSLEVNGKALNFVPFSAEGKNITFDQATGKAKISDMQLGVFSSKHIFNAELDTKTMLGNFGLDTKKALDIAELLQLTKVLPPQVGANLEKFALQGQITPQLKGDLKLPSEIHTLGMANLSNLAAKVAAFSLSDISGPVKLNASLNKQEASSEKVTLKLNGQPIELSFTAGLQNFKSVQLSQAEIKAFGGIIRAKAQAELTPEKPYQANAQISNLQIGTAISTVSPAAAKRIDGTVQSLDIQASGTLTEQPLRSVQAQGIANLVNARLIGINIVRLTLTAIDNLPFLNKNLYASIPESERGPIDSPDTNVDSIVTTYVFKNGVLNMNPLKLQSQLFSLDAQGTLSLDMEVDLSATITFKETITGTLVQNIKNISKVLDANGHLTLPLRIRGTIPKIMVYPDVSKLAKVAAERVLKDQAEKFLDKALKRGAKGKGLGGLLGF